MAIAMGWHKPDNVAGSSAPAVMVGSFVGTGGLLFGSEIGSINGIIAMQSFKDHFNTGYRNTTGQIALAPSQMAIIVAILTAGTFVGSLIGAPAGDKFGRRKSLIWSMGVFCVGVVFQICASTIPILLIGRFIAGIGVGIVSLLVPLYQSETAPRWIRGTLVCVYQFSITIGLMIACIVNVITESIEGSASYRIPIGLQLIWAVVLVLGLMFLPDTPRYLIRSGRRDEAAIALSRLRRLDITHPAITEELAEIQANYEYELTLGPSTYKELLIGTPHLGLRTFTGCTLQMLQQLSGMNAILYYGASFFYDGGIDNRFLISLIVSVINVISTVPGLYVVESWGRRKLLIVGAIGMAICQLTIAVFGTLATNGISGTVSAKILVALVSCYVFFYAASWGPVCWVVTAEIYPLKVRAKAMSVSTASNWLLNFGVAYGTPYMISDGEGYAGLGPKVFFVWGAFCVFAAIFVWHMVYETSKISLEQIDEMYERVDHAWNSKNFEVSWSFRQMRNEGVVHDGVLPTQQEPQTGRTSATEIVSEIHTDTAPSSHGEEQADKSTNHLEMAHVDFSY